MKRFILIICILLLTGCSAEVNINLNNGQIEENIKIYDYKQNILDSNNKLNENNKFWLDGFELNKEYQYETNTNDNNDILEKEYKATFDLAFWEDNSILKKCYNSYKIINNASYFSLKTDNKYICGKVYNAQNVVLKLNSNYEVIDNNADEFKDNTYIWYINDSTYEDEEIYFKVNKNKIVQNINDDNLFNIDYKIILISLGLIVLISTIYIYYKVKNSNK